MQGSLKGKELSSKHLEMSTEKVDQRKDDNKHVDTCDPETPNGRGSSEHSNSNHEVIIDGSESRSSSVGSEALIEVNVGDGRSLSSASSVEPSSLDDFLKPELLVKSESQASKPASEDELQHHDDDVSSDNSSAKSEVDNNDSPVLPLSNFAAPTVSPPVQVMDHSSGYDPKRIPSSIFARSSNNPMDWSTASNESLFSLHIGNSSFSQDHVINELYKSGELTKSTEFCMFSPPSFDMIPEDIEMYRKSVSSDQNLETNEEVSEQAFKPEEERFSSENQNQLQLQNSLPQDIINKFSNVSGHSRYSGTSTCSFAFPM